MGRASQNDHHGTQNGVQFGSHDGGHVGGFRAVVSININIGVGDGFDWVTAIHFRVKNRRLSVSDIKLIFFNTYIVVVFYILYRS